MFNFKDLSNSETEEEKFDPEAFRLSFADFLEKRRTAARPYVFDLRTAEEYEHSHLTGAYSLPMYHFEDAIYQMPYEGDILLYGGENDEGRQAAEILYENGFDTFYFIEDYQGLLESLRHARYSITNHAMERIRKRLQDSSLKGFRIVVKPISTKKARYGFAFVSAEEDTSRDTVLDCGDFDIYLDADAMLFLEGTTVDYDNTSEERFQVSNPEREVSPLNGDEKEMMEQLLAEQINPMVASHGGFVELIDIKDGRIYLEFGGGCKGCGMVSATLKQGVEVLVKENIPGIEEILDVTDHANGTNPYYQSGK